MTAEVRTLIASLTKERARIDRVLTALGALVEEGTPKRGRPAKKRGAKPGRPFSAEHRAHLAIAQKARFERERAAKAAALAATDTDEPHTGAIQ